MINFKVSILTVFHVQTSNNLYDTVAGFHYHKNVSFSDSESCSHDPPMYTYMSVQFIIYTMQTLHACKVVIGVCACPIKIWVIKL